MPSYLGIYKLFGWLTSDEETKRDDLIVHLVVGLKQGAMLMGSPFWGGWWIDPDNSYWQE